jgi:HD superfamily phosphohydrolase
MSRWICVFLWVCALYAERVETFYGPIEVDEPILLELIESPAMQRLKQIHQYGVAYYTTHKEEYNRFDHSVGVFAVLRKNGACIEEQVSGLLHDVSHTVFSHVGDWLFGKEHQEDDYQGMIFKQYLRESGLEEILTKHGFEIDEVLPKGATFVMLEQPLPNLCADRIDYNIQGAYFQGFLTAEESRELFDDFQFVEGRWVSTRVDLLRKLADFSLFMTQDCWGSACNCVMSRWLADAMKRGLDTELLTRHDIHFGVDSDVWMKLIDSDDPYICDKMHRLVNPQEYYKMTDPAHADQVFKFRCRGVDPWIVQDGHTVRLTGIDSELAEKFKAVQAAAESGWSVQLF